MHNCLKLPILLLITHWIFHCIVAAPIDATYTKTSEIEDKLKTVSKFASPIEKINQNNAASCLSLWDVDANLIKHARKDQEHRMKYNGNNRHKRYDLKEKSKNVSKDTTNKIGKNKESLKVSNCLSLWDVDANLLKHAKKDQEHKMKYNSNNRHKRNDLKEKSKNVSKDMTNKIEKNKNSLKTSNCLSLWDVDANLIKQARKDQDHRMKYNNNNRQKRFDVKGKSDKVSKDTTTKIEKTQEYLKDKKEPKRSSTLVNLVCTKTAGGVQCYNNNTEVVFNGVDISDDEVKEGIQALLSNGAFNIKGKNNKKKTRGCGCGDAVTEETPPWCSTQSITCEVCTQSTIDDCVITLEPTERLDDKTICADTTSPCKTTACDNPVPNGHFIKPVRSEKTEFLRPAMYLECTAEEGPDPAVYSCTWKHKN